MWSARSPSLLPPSPHRCIPARLNQGSKWTSIEKTLGYDFFTATSTRKHEGAASGRVSWLVEMAAAGDPSVRLWVPEEVVADRSAWIAGWKEGIWQARFSTPSVAFSSPLRSDVDCSAAPQTGAERRAEAAVAERPGERDVPALRRARPGAVPGVQRSGQAGGSDGVTDQSHLVNTCGKRRWLAGRMYNDQWSANAWSSYL